MKRPTQAGLLQRAPVHAKVRYVTPRFASHLAVRGELLAEAPLTADPAFQAISRQLSSGLVGNGKLERYAIFGARDTRDVALAGRVFDQVDVSGSHIDLFSARHFELGLTAEGNHILAARGRVPINDRAGRRTVQLPSRDLH